MALDYKETHNWIVKKTVWRDGFITAEPEPYDKLKGKVMSKAVLRFFKVRQDGYLFKPKVRDRWYVTANWEGNIYSNSYAGYETQEEARRFMMQWLTQCKEHRLETITEEVEI